MTPRQSELALHSVRHSSALDTRTSDRMFVIIGFTSLLVLVESDLSAMMCSLESTGQICSVIMIRIKDDIA